MFLPTDLQQFVGAEMSLGNYETFDDLVADALVTLRDKKRAELVEQIELGLRQIENGECITLSSEAEVQAFFDDIISKPRDKHLVTPGLSTPPSQSRE